MSCSTTVEREEKMRMLMRRGAMVDATLQSIDRFKFQMVQMWTVNQVHSYAWRVPTCIAET